VIFLHEVTRGTADRSYGVQVARLAGLPQIVVERAKVVLDALEKGEREGGSSRKAVIDDLPLFSVTPTTAPVKQVRSQVEDRLKTILPDDLTPKDALSLIYELRTMLSDD
jgi:DNA mismatch repair protein MutS